MDEGATAPPPRGFFRPRRNYLHAQNLGFRWGMRKHGDKGKEWIAERYWHRKENRKWAFCTEKNVLFRPSDVKKKRHVKIRNSVNPYIDREYFMEHQKSRKYERGYRDKSFAM